AAPPNRPLPSRRGSLASLARSSADRTARRPIYDWAMAIKRMDHVGIVVDDLPAAIDFFTQPGLTVMGEAPVEGTWVDRVIGMEESGPTSPCCRRQAAKERHSSYRRCARRQAGTGVAPRRRTL